MFEHLIGPVIAIQQPQAVFPEEDLEQALRQLILFGREGLPVISHNDQQLEGWITRQDVLRALGDRVTASTPEIERGALAAEFAVEDPEARLHVPTTPLEGYRMVAASIGPNSPARGRPVGEIELPAGAVRVAVSDGGEMVAPRNDIQLRAGDEVILLAPAPSEKPADEASEAPALTGPAACRRSERRAPPRG
ncbi:MAG TPA: TrkA C-terminal domain-containing protein [Solirubrobacteraceae bacterium]